MSLYIHQNCSPAQLLKVALALSSASLTPNDKLPFTILPLTGLNFFQLSKLFCFQNFNKINK